MVIVLLSCSSTGFVGPGVSDGVMLSDGGAVSGAELTGAYVSTGAVFAGAGVSVGGTLVGTTDSTGAGLGFSAGAVFSDSDISGGAAVSDVNVCAAGTEGVSLSAGSPAVQAASSMVKAIIKISIRFIYHPALRNTDWSCPHLISWSLRLFIVGYRSLIR